MNGNDPKICTDLIISELKEKIKELKLDGDCYQGILQSEFNDAYYNKNYHKDICLTLSDDYLLSNIINIMKEDCQKKNIYLPQELWYIIKNYIISQ